jgi:serine/threonine-protein kinase
VQHVESGTTLARVSEATQMIGRVVDRYRIEALLGEGGFGAVYRASHIHMHRAVALKILHARHAQEPGVVERFMREARAAAAAGSEHIVEVYDCGLTESGEAFLALELLDGEDLDARLGRGACSVDETLAIAGEVLEGLAAAHAAGVIHRDLKPANIFLARAPQVPRVKLLDFGISKMLELDAEELTRAGTTLGTPHYMALEQFMSARDVDARADLYALGVVMYEMVSGALPFDAESFEGMAVKLATEPPRPLGQVAPHCPASFVQVVERALARDRDARFASASAMALALRSVRGGAAMSAFTGTKPVPRAAAPSVALTPPTPWGAVDPSGATAMAPSTPPPPVPSSARASAALPTPYPAPTPGPVSMPRSASAAYAGQTSHALPAQGTPWLRVALLGLFAAGGAALGIVLLLEALSGEPSRTATTPAAGAPAEPLAAPSAQLMPSSPQHVTLPGTATPPSPPKPELRQPAAPENMAPTSMRESAPRTRRPRATARAAELPPEATRNDERPNMAASGVHFRPPHIVGPTNRAGVAALLQRARPRLGHCQEPGVRRTVRVQVMPQPNGEIALSQPARWADPGDPRTAACVARVLRGLGPIAGGGAGVVQITVDL